MSILLSKFNDNFFFSQKTLGKSKMFVKPSLD